MTTIATLAVKLIADSKGFQETMGQAEKTTQTWSQSVSKNMMAMGENVTNVGQKATTFLTLPLLAAGVAAINYASDLDETKNKVSVVFGDMGDDVLKWGENAAVAMGQSQEQALAAAATYGNLFVTMGVGNRESADMSTNLVQLASDLASFNNASPQEVLDAMQSGLVGMSMPMRKFGVNINEAAVALKAMEMGLVESNVDMLKLNGLMLDAEKVQLAYNLAVEKYGEESLEARSAAQKLAEIEAKLEEATAGVSGEISDAAKVQARYALIMEQTGTAHGDFARTSDGLANSQRILKAQYIDAAAALGAQLLPYAIQLVSWVSGLITKFQALTPEQQKWVVIIGVVVAAVGPLLMVLGTLITAVGAVIGVIGAISAPVLIVVAVIAALIAVGYLLYQAWTNNWGGIQEKTQIAIDFVKGLIAGGMQFVQDLTSGKLGAVSEIWERTMSTIALYFEAGLKQIKLIGELFKAAFSGDWRRFGEILREMWDNAWNMMKTIVSTAWENIKTAVSALVKNIIEYFKTINWGEVGLNILKGIGTGMLGAIPMLIGIVKNVGGAVMDAFKGFFGISSPARRPRVEVGVPIGQGGALGVMEGWETMMPNLQHIMDTMSSMAEQTFGNDTGAKYYPGWDSPLPKMPASAAKGGSQQPLIVTVDYHPLISTADENEARFVLAPMIADEIRNREKHK